jgi:hypothetical protein
MARRVPELREALFYRRCFLSRRSAAFDLAVVGAAVGVARRRPLALAAALPYARMLARDARYDGGPQVAAARLAADAVGAAAMAYGSLVSGSLLI